MWARAASSSAAPARSARVAIPAAASRAVAPQQQQSRQPISVSSSASSAASGNPGVFLPGEVDMKRIVFREPVQNQFGGQHIFVALDSGDGNGGTNPVRVQTPWLTLPFGLSQYGPESPWQLMCALSEGENPEEQSEMAKFSEFLDAFDARIVEEGVNNAKDWWPGKTMIPEIVGYNYRSPLKPSSEETTFPPSLKVRVRRNNETQDWLCDVFEQGNESQKLPPLETLTRGTQAKIIMMCTGLWFVHGNWGCSWRALQVLVRPRQASENSAQGNNAELDGPSFR
jgi:Family of unknown function (DUF5871)